MMLCHYLYDQTSLYKQTCTTGNSTTVTITAEPLTKLFTLPLPLPPASSFTTGGGKGVPQDREDTFSSSSAMNTEQTRLMTMLSSAFCSLVSRVGVVYNHVVMSSMGSAFAFAYSKTTRQPTFSSFITTMMLKMDTWRSSTLCERCHCGP